MKNKEIILEGELLQCLAEKALYWPSQRVLFISDLHLGKITHFRNNGIPVPQKAEDKNWDELSTLLLNYKIEKVYFLGDLFHSKMNTSWDGFKEIIAVNQEKEFVLIEGNHDIIAQEYYASLNIKQYSDFEIGPFRLSHFPPEQKHTKYTLCGHIHPGIKLKGKGYQSITLPCFYFSKFYGILPAFGTFTGLGIVEPVKTDIIYVIADDMVMELV